MNVVYMVEESYEGALRYFARREDAEAWLVSEGLDSDPTRFWVSEEKVY